MSLAGYCFCITGVMRSGERDEVHAFIRSHGGNVSTTVCSKTSHLLANPNELNPPTNKVKAARERGIFIVSEAFLDAQVNSSVRVDETPFILSTNSGTNYGSNNRLRLIVSWSLALGGGIARLIADLSFLPLLMVGTLSWRSPWMCSKLWNLTCTPEQTPRVERRNIVLSHVGFVLCDALALVLLLPLAVTVYRLPRLARLLSTKPPESHWFHFVFREVDELEKDIGGVICFCILVLTIYRVPRTIREIQRCTSWRGAVYQNFYGLWTDLFYILIGSLQFCALALSLYRLPSALGVLIVSPPPTSTISRYGQLHYLCCQLMMDIGAPTVSLLALLVALHHFSDSWLTLGICLVFAEGVRMCVGSYGDDGKLIHLLVVGLLSPLQFSFTFYQFFCTRPMLLYESATVQKCNDQARRLNLGHDVRHSVSHFLWLVSGAWILLLFVSWADWYVCVKQSWALSLERAQFVFASDPKELKKQISVFNTRQRSCFEMRANCLKTGIKAILENPLCYCWTFVRQMSRKMQECCHTLQCWLSRLTRNVHCFWINSKYPDLLSTWRNLLYEQCKKCQKQPGQKKEKEKTSGQSLCTFLCLCLILCLISLPCFLTWRCIWFARRLALVSLPETQKQSYILNHFATEIRVCYATLFRDVQLFVCVLIMFFSIVGIPRLVSLLFLLFKQQDSSTPKAQEMFFFAARESLLDVICVIFGCPLLCLLSPLTALKLLYSASVSSSIDQEKERSMGRECVYHELRIIAMLRLSQIQHLLFSVGCALVVFFVVITVFQVPELRRAFQEAKEAKRKASQDTSLSSASSSSSPSSSSTSCSSSTPSSSSPLSALPESAAVENEYSWQVVALLTTGMLKKEQVPQWVGGRAWLNPSRSAAEQRYARWAEVARRKRDSDALPKHALSKRKKPLNSPSSKELDEEKTPAKRGRKRQALLTPTRTEAEEYESEPEPDRVVTRSKRKALAEKIEPSKKSKATLCLDATEQAHLDAIQSYTVDTLKMLLRKNNMPITGLKKELQIRVCRAMATGVPPRCPSCGGGFLHVSLDGQTLVCRGHFDDMDFVSCKFSAPRRSLPSERWLA